jgi:LacI family transcriptional regulator
MKSIAEAAGVTLTTVSRVLNDAEGKFKYADDTRKRILDIASRLKYRPNALVRGMQTGRTGTAGVMVPIGGFYSLVVAGIHEVFVNNATIMLLSWNHRSVNDREEVLERQIIHQMVDRRVQGIILRPSSEDFERSYFEEIWERQIPLILIDRRLSKIETDFVGTDDIYGGRAAAEHLIQLGHRSLLFVGFGTATSTSRDRERGFRRVVSETPGAHCKSIVFGEDTIADDLMQSITGRNPPTAIFCYNDSYAHSTAKVIEQAGLAIPKDISLIGFGNVKEFEFKVPLTTFAQHQIKIGNVAATLYLDRIRQGRRGAVRRELIKPDLMVRQSTAPLSR